MPTLAEGALLLASYLLGSVPFAFLLGKAHGIDIREHGSGNVGATNLGRALGRRWGIAAFVLDFLKGLSPVLVARGLAGADRFGLAQAAAHIELGAGAAAIVGHVFPLWLGFRGGKGVATTFGAMTGLAWIATLAAGALWALVFGATRTVSVASLAAGAALPVAVWLTHWGRPLAEFGGTLSVASAVAVLIVVRHRSNIVRIVRGEEPRFRRGARIGTRDDRDRKPVAPRGDAGDPDGG